MVTWTVEPDDVVKRVWLSPGDGENWSLDPGEAWDLGDDLIAAADQLLPFDSVGYTTRPPWADVVKVAVVNGRLRLVCDEHYVDILYPGMMITISEAMDQARKHWALDHLAEVDVAEHAEGEDGQAHTDPTVPEAPRQAEALHDAHGGSDQVQDDLDE